MIVRLDIVGVERIKLKCENFSCVRCWNGFIHIGDSLILDSKLEHVKGVASSAWIAQSVVDPITDPPKHLELDFKVLVDETLKIFGIK